MDASSNRSSVETDPVAMSSTRDTDAVIVIFGAAVRPDGGPSTTLRVRVEAAAAFGARFTAPLFLPTGGKGRHGASEASVMARLLREMGVPPDRILLEETGTDTLSSVRAVARMLAGTASVYVATSGYHQPRCLLLLRLAGIAAFACPPPPTWMGFWQRWFWRLRELVAIPYDGVLGLLLRLRGRW
jgi:vancomycin permeability regulator SanA